MKDSSVAAPCLHAGAPRPEVLSRTVDAIKAIGSRPALLAEFGLSTGEFASAFSGAIESLRGSMSASNSNRREFLTGILRHLVDVGLASRLSTPSYGDDTVYRLDVPGIGAVAIVQKGCPDGAHSSSRWAVPAWADETYLWWLCSSTTSQPGEHIARGVNRLRQRFMSDEVGELSGVIFHNELCGSASRPCPKRERSAVIDGSLVPAPCVYVMPRRNNKDSSWNWMGDRQVRFPEILLKAFSIEAFEAEDYTGFVGFQRRDGGNVRTTLTTRFGAGRSSTYRS